MQPHQRRILYRIELAAAVAFVCLFVLTLIDPQWIETLFDEAPDGGDGSLERWILLGCTSVGAVLAGVLAWRERRQIGTGGAEGTP